MIGYVLERSKFDHASATLCDEEDAYQSDMIGIGCIRKVYYDWLHLAKNRLWPVSASLCDEEISHNYVVHDMIGQVIASDLQVNHDWLYPSNKQTLVSVSGMISVM